MSYLTCMPLYSSKKEWKSRRAHWWYCVKDDVKPGSEKVRQRVIKRRDSKKWGWSLSQTSRRFLSTWEKTFTRQKKSVHFWQKLGNKKSIRMVCRLVLVWSIYHIHHSTKFACPCLYRLSGENWAHLHIPNKWILRKSWCCFLNNLYCWVRIQADSSWILLSQGILFAWRMELAWFFHCKYQHHWLVTLLWCRCPQSFAYFPYSTSFEINQLTTRDAGTNLDHVKVSPRTNERAFLFDVHLRYLCDLRRKLIQRRAL